MNKSILLSSLVLSLSLSSCMDEFDDFVPTQLKAGDGISKMAVRFVDNSDAEACAKNTARIEIFGETSDGKPFSTRRGQPTGTLLAPCSMFKVKVNSEIGNYISDEWSTLEEGIATVLDSCDLSFKKGLLDVSSPEEKLRISVEATYDHYEKSEKTDSGSTVITRGEDAKEFTYADCTKNENNALADIIIRTKKKFIGSYYQINNAGTDEQQFEVYTLEIDNSGKLNHSLKVFTKTGEQLEQSCQVSEADGFIKVKDQNTNSAVTESTQNTYISVNCSTQIEQAKKYTLDESGNLKIDGLPNVYKRYSSSDQNIMPWLNQNVWLTKEVIIENAHNYPNNTNQSFEVAIEGARVMKLYFEKIQVENNHDYVRIIDKNNKIIQTLTGNYNDYNSYEVTGDRLYIQLTSDSSYGNYGFKVTKIFYKQ